LGCQLCKPILQTLSDTFSESLRLRLARALGVTVYSQLPFAFYPGE
jgi:hypothetical protein